MIVQTVSQIARPRDFIRLGGDPCGVQRLDLTRYQQRAVRTDMVIKRFNAESVTRRKQFLFALVPDQEGEHPDESVQTSRAPSLVSGQYDFGVASALVFVIAQLGS